MPPHLFAPPPPPPLRCLPRKWRLGLKCDEEDAARDHQNSEAAPLMMTGSNGSTAAAAAECDKDVFQPLLQPTNPRPKKENNGSPGRARDRASARNATFYSPSFQRGNKVILRFFAILRHFSPRSKVT